VPNKHFLCYIMKTIKEMIKTCREGIILFGFDKDKESYGYLTAKSERERRNLHYMDLFSELNTLQICKIIIKSFLKKYPKSLRKELRKELLGERK